MAQMTRQKKANPKKKPETIAKEFDIEINPWEGLIVSQDPWTIPETSSIWVEGLPKLTGTIEGVLAPLLRYTHTATIQDYFYFKLTNDFHGLLDGSNLVFLDNTFVSVGSFATTDIKCDFALQGSSAIWVVTRNFLVTFDGTTVRNLSGRNVKGDAICYWKGRIFIGKDRTIAFSVPNPDYTNVNNPFDTANGAGYITINIGSFSKILALIPKEDSIYIITDNNIIGLLGTTISNDPTQWYLTEILSGYGISGVRKYTKYEHTIYCHTNKGMLSLVATAPDSIDDAISNITVSVDDVSYFVYKNIPYVTCISNSYMNPDVKTVYCYNLLFKKWFTIPVEAKVLSSFGADSYIASGSKIKKLFGGSTYLPVKVKTKTFFNTSNIYFNLRRIYLYGRGNSSINCKVINEAGVEHSLERESPYTVNSFLFNNSYGNFLFSNSWGDFLYGQSPEFFLNQYKQSNELGFRLKQFTILLEEEDTKEYSELINLRVKGTLGARYM